MKNGIQELGDMVKSNCTHHWIINSSNVGRCRDCPEVRDFGELLVREGQYFKKAGRRGAKVSKVTRNPYSRRGRRPKYE